MQIQTVQAQSFQAKQRFLPKNTHSQVKELLNRMNSKTKCVEDDMRFSADILGMVKINSENANFFDKRYLVRPVKDSFIGESDLEFGKVKLTFDNATGEIKKYKNPFFTSWKKIMEKAGEIISKACDSFGDDTLVEKKFIGIAGMTEKGAKIIEEARRRVAAHTQAHQAGKKLASQDKTFLEPLNGVF